MGLHRTSVRYQTLTDWNQAVEKFRCINYYVCFKKIKDLQLDLLLQNKEKKYGRD